jgi:hypothetical protein
MLTTRPPKPSGGIVYSVHLLAVFFNYNNMHGMRKVKGVKVSQFLSKSNYKAKDII